MAMKYRTIQEYSDTIEVLSQYTVQLLVSFSNYSRDIRDVIIRNFIARGITALTSILHLWYLGHFQDCWILHRALIDRFFLLVALNEDNAFEVFEKWSFVQKYDAKNKVLSDREFRNKVPKEALSFTKQEKMRYAEIRQENIFWSRPKAEKIAKNIIKLPFLYSYGYDYASTQVHPMADDGEGDYSRLIENKPWPTEDHIAVVHNSILMQSLLTQEGLNASNLYWRRIVYDFLSQCNQSLELGNNIYLETWNKLQSAGSEFNWCRASNNELAT
jgi:hypothetical protein